jgi:hypothetical protein
MHKTYKKNNPFKGTQPYQKEDFGKLFGRSEDLIKMKDRIFSDRTTLLFASSGVGKTSLLNALVIPSLEEIYDILYFKYWATNDIYHEIKNSFVYQVRKYENKKNDESLNTLKENIEDLIQDTSLNTLKEILENVFKDRRVLIIFDQFEEAFQHHQYIGYFNDFLEDIAKCINENDGTLKFVFSMREEFLGDLSAFDNLIPDLFNNYYRLKYPSKDQAKRIIIDTVHLEKDVEIDEGNLSLLIEDLSKIDLPSFSEKSNIDDQNIIGKPFITPTYLQIVCHRLWKESVENYNSSKKVFLEDYESQLSISSIKEFAYHILNGLYFREKKRFSKMLHYFITTKGSKLFITLDNLSNYIGQKSNKIENTLDKLTKETGKLFHKSKRADESIWYGIQHDVFIPILKEWREEFRRIKLIRYISTIVFFISLLIAISIFVYPYYYEDKLENNIKESLLKFNETPTFESLSILEDNFRAFKNYSTDSLKIANYSVIITQEKNEFQVGIVKKEEDLLFAIEASDYESLSSIHNELSKSINDTSHLTYLEDKIAYKVKDKAISDFVKIKDSLGHGEALEYINKLEKANIKINDLKHLVLNLRNNVRESIHNLEEEKETLRVGLEELGEQREEMETAFEDERDRVKSKIKNIYSLVSNDITIINPPDGRIKRSSITNQLPIKFRINPIYNSASIYINNKLLKSDSMSLSILNSQLDTILLKTVIKLSDTTIIKNLNLIIDDEPPKLSSIKIYFKSGNQWLAIPDNELLLGTNWKFEGIISEPVKYCNINTYVWNNFKNKYEPQGSYYSDLRKNGTEFNLTLRDVNNYYDYFPNSRKVKIIAVFEDLLGHWNKDKLFEGYIPANFRKKPKNLRIVDIKLELLSLGFFDKKYRNYPYAGFFNDFRRTDKNGLEEIIDYRSGLVWLTGKVLKNITFNNSLTEIKHMNENKVNNFNTWRIPAIQEAYSLLESKINAKKQYISDDFPSIRNIWIIDNLAPLNEPLGLSFEGGTFTQGLKDVSLLVVRNMVSIDLVE